LLRPSSTTAVITSCAFDMAGLPRQLRWPTMSRDSCQLCRETRHCTCHHGQRSFRPMTVRSSQTYRAGVGMATLTMSPGRRQSVSASPPQRISRQPTRVGIGPVAPVPPAKRSRCSATSYPERRRAGTPATTCFSAPTTCCASSRPSVMAHKALSVARRLVTLPD